MIFHKVFFPEIIVIKVILGMCIFTLTSHKVHNLHVFFNISTKVNYLQNLFVIIYYVINKLKAL